jgi:hypothetical protein
MPVIEAFGSGNYPYIHVVLLSAEKRMLIKECKCVENRAIINKKWGWEVEFTGDMIGSVFVRRPPTFRHRYVPAIFVREGANVAMKLDAVDTTIRSLVTDKKIVYKVEGSEETKTAEAGAKVGAVTKATYLTNPADFVAPLTQEENSRMIKRKMAQAIASGKLLTTTQFAVLMVGICIIIVLVAANLFGVHLSATTGPILTPTPTHAIGNFTLPGGNTTYVIPGT